MKVVIVGSREYPNLSKVRAYIQNLPIDTVIVSGGAKGVDKCAEKVAESIGLQTEIYPADYHLEHNFGHGQKHLSALLATFNILSFLFHTLLDIIDKKYQLIRQNLPSLQTFFDDLRALTRYLFFDSWNNLLDFMILGLELEFPPP